MSEAKGNSEPTSGPTRRVFEDETKLDSRDPANKQALHTWLDQYDKRIAREKAQKQHPSPSGKINMKELGYTLKSEEGETPETDTQQELTRNEHLLQAKKGTQIAQHADPLPPVKAVAGGEK